MSATVSDSANQTPPAVPAWFWDAALAVAIGLVAMLVYFGGVDGDFVYDDARQIVKNPLIQDNQHIWRALKSDVWAFKGNAPGHAWSNYWRPTFVAFLILEHRLFGLGHTEPWHLANLLLHGLASGLSFGFARRLGIGRAAALLIGLVFAVHPSHVESVEWISGSPDLLLAPCLIGSLWLMRSHAERSSVWKLGAALALYAVAQGAKEVAIFQCVLVALTVMTVPRGESVWRSASRGVVASIPFFVLGVVYIFLRLRVLGAMSTSIDGSPEIAKAFWTLPSMFWFYVSQSFYPAVLGPNYPIRPITSDAVTASNVWIPLALCAVAVSALLVLAWRDRVARLGAALFLLPLAPAMNIAAFAPDQLVHDRYLYLPLLGLGIAVFPAIVGASCRLLGGKTGAAAAVMLGMGASAWLALRTISYVPAWTSDLALWQRGVEVDPDGAFVQSQLGVFLTQAGKPEEAVAAFDKAIATEPTLIFRIGRAEALMNLSRFNQAEADLLLAIEAENPSVAFMAVERLVLCLSKQDRVEDAAKLMRESRDRPGLSLYRCALTEKLAVVLYNDGRKDEALAELRSVRGLVKDEFGGPGKLVLLRLGQLCIELGHGDEAKDALRDYLVQTRAMSDAETLQLRQLAQNLLTSLGG